MLTSSIQNTSNTLAGYLQSVTINLPNTDVFGTDLLKFSSRKLHLHVPLIAVLSLSGELN